jgi:hypothetical protein
MKIKVKGMQSVIVEIADKTVRGFDIGLQINTTEKGDVLYEATCFYWKGKKSTFTEGIDSYPTLEEAVEKYNSYK